MQTHPDGEKSSRMAPIFRSFTVSLYKRDRVFDQGKMYQRVVWMDRKGQFRAHRKITEHAALSRPPPSWVGGA